MDSAHRVARLPDVARTLLSGQHRQECLCHTPPMKFETKAVHAGAKPDDATGAIAPPIELSTTFERNATDGEPAHGYSYIRDHNPTQARLEAALAAIDSGEAALVFGSGMAAASALFQML